MSTSGSSKSSDTSVCANCGKEGDSDNMNTCNKCKMVKYCNAVCKKKHRSKHKKKCEEHVRLAAEHAAKLHDDELFKQPPSQYGDCPICFLRLPTLLSGSKYMSCCGKVICCGCIHVPLYDNQGNEVDKHKCPFCRIPTSYTNEEVIEREKKRLEVDDPIAIHNLGCYYEQGMYGYEQDYMKALTLYHRAGEFGYTRAYYSIGYAYYNGRGVEVDKKKAIHYWELGAIGGHVSARHNLGSNEYLEEGSIDRALKHYMIAVRGGYADSLESVNLMYEEGHATKEEYTKALRLYQEYLSEIKSAQRDKAASERGDYRYY